MSSERKSAPGVFKLKAHHRPLFELLEKGHAFEVGVGNGAEAAGGEWVQLLAHLLATGFLEPADVNVGEVWLPPGSVRQ